jgi:hypothetical protein
MSVKVALVKDTIRKDGGLVPRIVQRGSIGFDRLISTMKKGTGISQDDLRSYFNHLSTALEELLPEGAEVMTPIGAFKLSLHRRAGTAATSQDRKISSDDMRIQLRADRGFVERVRLAASIHMVDTPAPLAPCVIRVENADLGGSVGSGSVGQILHIQGSRLSFDREDQEQGVFLVSDAAPAEATRIAVYSRIGSNIVDGKIPVLAAGTYTLELRTRPTAKDIRTGSYDGTIAIS